MKASILMWSFHSEIVNYSCWWLLSIVHKHTHTTHKHNTHRVTYCTHNIQSHGEHVSWVLSCSCLFSFPYLSCLESQNSSSLCRSSACMMLSRADSPGMAIGTPGRYLLTHRLFLWTFLTVPNDGTGARLPALLLPPLELDAKDDDDDVIRCRSLLISGFLMSALLTTGWGLEEYMYVITCTLIVTYRNLQYLLWTEEASYWLCLSNVYLRLSGIITLF